VHLQVILSSATYRLLVLDAGIQVIAPWREWDLSSRESLMDYAQKHGIEIDYQKQNKKSPYSMDAN
jgi:argininosuccinate synthase